MLSGRYQHIDDEFLALHFARTQLLQLKAGVACCLRVLACSVFGRASAAAPSKPTATAK